MTEKRQSIQNSGSAGVPPEIASAPTLGAGAPGGGELVLTPGQMDLPAKVEFASTQTGYINGYITLADTKAAWVFAIPAAALAYLTAQQDLWGLLTSPNDAWVRALAVFTVALLLVSAIAAFSVIVPRLRGAPDGIVYFGSVAKRGSARDYIADLASLSEEALLDARLQHNFEIARVCQRKYRTLRLAMWSGLIALAAVLALLTTLRLSPPETQSPSSHGGKPTGKARP